MANNTISQVEINGTTYDLLDANTLSALDSLKMRVTTLEDSVSTDYTPLAGTGNFSAMRGSINCVGKLCILGYHGGDTITTASGWQTIGTIPNGYRPKENIDCNGWQWNSRVDARLLTDGIIQAFLASGTNQRLQIKVVAYLRS